MVVPSPIQSSPCQQVWLHHVESSEDTHLFRELPHILRNEVAWNALQAAMA